MKKLLLVALLAVLPGLALAQTAGIQIGTAPSSPGGSSGQVQYNASGLFAGMSGTSWNDTNRALVIGGNSGQIGLSLLNGTNAQTYRVYNTFTDASNGEWGTFDWATAANVLTIGTANNGTGVARNLQFIIGGVSKADYGITLSGAWTFITSVSVASLRTLNINNSNNTNTLWTFANSSANAIFSTGSAAPLMQFAGATASFPAIKRSTTILQARLADDSAYTPFEASTLRTATAFTVATLPAAGSAGRRAYVTDQLTTCAAIGAAPTGGGAVVCPVFDNGTAWVGG